MLVDRQPLQKRLAGLVRRLKAGKPADKGLQVLRTDIQTSQQRLLTRKQALPQPTYPEELPVSGRRDEIAEAIEQHQVVIIAGETGSGKTTQLPKICLQMGRGVAGMIAHTQPRRIAASAVARRILKDGFDLVFALATTVIVPGRNLGVEFPRADNNVSNFFRCDLQHGGVSFSWVSSANS